MGMETRRVSEGYTDACFPSLTRRVSKKPQLQKRVVVSGMADSAVIAALDSNWGEARPTWATAATVPSYSAFVG